MNTSVLVCGTPELCLWKDTAQFAVMLHSSDPECEVHAEIRLCIRRDGYFWFEREWLLP